MSIKNLVEMIKRNGLLASMPQLEELYQVAIENELKLADSQHEFRAADATIENLQMQVEKLAAENAGLKVACGGDGSYRDCPACAHSEYIEAPETPATAAFLAEVRAQGVEMFAAHKRERQQALRSRSMRMSEEAAGMAADAEDFADQLRKGAQS